MVSEKVGGAEGTKLDDDFRDLERVREASCGLKKHLFAKCEDLIGVTQCTTYNPPPCGSSVVNVHTSLKHYLIFCRVTSCLDLEFVE